MPQALIDDGAGAGDFGEMPAWRQFGVWKRRGPCGIRALSMSRPAAANH